jgi:hypothetical protein
MSKAVAFVSPFSSGPGGSRFELLVATFYLTSMLKGEIPLGYDNGGLIESVKLQQRNKGNPVDDVVIQSQKGELSIQVKHSVRFTSNKSKTSGKYPEFYEALSQCWSLFNSASFKRDIDCFGIAFNEATIPIKTRSNLNDTIDWAKRERTVKSYLKQLGKSEEKKKYFDIFQDLLSDISETHIDDNTTWEFIRHFVILPFDFNQSSGHSTNELQNKLLDISKFKSPDNAKTLLSILYYLATDYAITGGEHDCFSLEKRLPMNVYAPINNVSSYILQKNLELHLKQKIEREIKSKKYIPGLFTESPNANEDLRIFSDPVLFIQKIVEDLQRVDVYLYNEFATKLNFPLLKIEPPNTFRMPNTISDAIDVSDILKNYVSSIIKDLKDLDPYKGKKIKKYVTDTNRSLFKAVDYRFYGCILSVQHELERIEHGLGLIKSQVLIIEGKAASGKTNFICNFADRTLRTRQQTSFYITGYDLSNEATTTSLRLYLINRFNEEYDGKLSRLSPDIEKICLKEKKPVLIIIDGINEHSDLSHFAGQLEQVIEEFTSTIYIKFILTCRSENFDKRFSNLKTASFADKLSVIQNFSHNIAPIHKKFMIHVYFKYFKLICHPSEEVIDTFIKNPLILRLFCEGYGSENGKNDVTIGPLYSIHLSILFDRYNSRISNHFEKKYPDTGFKRKYGELLNKLADYMLINKKFSNVPVNSISSEFDRIVAILVNEGVILRKDLPDKKSITLDSEVLNFTYDEFRDYILADYLVKIISVDNFDRFKELFAELVSPDCPVSEGIGYYTFVISRRDHNKRILGYLKTLDNYDEIYIRAIFTIDNSLIFQEDLETIKRLFQKDSHIVELIYSGLLHRRDKTEFPILNIWLFFDLVSQLNKSEYIRLIRPIFSLSHNWLDATYDGIKNIIGGCTKLTIEFDAYTSLIEILICLSPRVNSYELFFEIAKKHPKLTTSLLKKYLENPESYVGETMWHILAFSQLKAFYNDEIYRLALTIRNTGSTEKAHDLQTSIDFFISTLEGQND